jgi:putative membrane protein
MTKYYIMEIVAKILIAIVAIEHIYILWMEMFAWETKGKEVFKAALPADMFKPTKGLAANQGLYNGFLSAGLIWSLFIEDPKWQTNVALFFLSCVAVAGIYGADSATKKIFFVQALPAILAIVAMLLR